MIHKPCGTFADVLILRDGRCTGMMPTVRPVATAAGRALCGKYQ
jgi:hypothetical protein